MRSGSRFPRSSRLSRLLQTMLGGGSISLVVVQGPAGLGKSALLDEAARRLGQRHVARVEAGAELAAFAAAINGGPSPSTTVLIDDAGEDDLPAVARLRSASVPTVVATRSASTWVGADHLLGGRARVVSAEELLFTTDEIAELAAALRIDLGRTGAVELRRTTDGWPALVDAALRASRPEATLSARRLRELGDSFIRAEVLAAIPAAQRELLSCAAAVPSFDAAVLTCLLAGHAESADPVGLIEQWAASGWLIHADEADHWRIPAPIRQPLLTDLDARRPGRRAELATAAVTLLVASGKTSQALPYAVDASLDQLLVELLRDGARQALANGRFTDVLPALDTLPDRAIAADPALLLLAAVAALAPPPDLDTFALRLDQAEAVIDHGSLNGPLLALHALRMQLARARGDAAEARHHERQAQARVADATDAERHEHAGHLAYLGYQVGATRLADGDLEAADRFLTSAMTLARSNGADWHAAISDTLLGFVSFVRGDLAAAQRRTDTAGHQSRDHGWSEHPFTDHQQLTLGLLELEQGRTWGVWQLLENAQLRLSRDAEPPAARLALAWSTFAMLRQGAAAAERALVLCGPTYPTNRLPLDLLLARVARAQAHLAVGEPRTALLDLDEVTGPRGHAALAAVTRARARLALDDPRRALRELDSHGVADDVLPLTTRADITAIRLECVLRQGRDGEQLFHQLVAVLQRTGARRPVLLLPHVREAAIAGRLTTPPPMGLDAFGVEIAALKRANEHGRPTLSARELEVLAAMAGPSTLSDIAKDLYVSDNTLKTTSRSIYRKLGAADRREAVEAARALGVLPGLH